MIRSFTAAMLLGTAILSSGAATAAPVPREQLLVAPAGARHFTISSAAGKHGDIWGWTMLDGRSAYRMSMSLRGWITETDQTVLNGRPRPLAHRDRRRLGADRRQALLDFRRSVDRR